MLRFFILLRLWTMDQDFDFTDGILVHGPTGFLDGGSFSFELRIGEVRYSVCYLGGFQHIKDGTEGTLTVSLLTRTACSTNIYPHEIKGLQQFLVRYKSDFFWKVDYILGRQKQSEETQLEGLHRLFDLSTATLTLKPCLSTDRRSMAFSLELEDVQFHIETTNTNLARVRDEGRTIETSNRLSFKVTIESNAEKGWRENSFLVDPEEIKGFREFASRYEAEFEGFEGFVVSKRKWSCEDTTRNIE